MNLFIKKMLIFFLCCYVHNSYSALTTAEKHKADLLRAHLRILAKRSQTRPLLPARERGVDAIVNQLELFARKDPESKVFEGVEEMADAIQYKEAESVGRAEKPKKVETIKPPKEESVKKKPPVETIDPLQQFETHLARLKGKQSWDLEKGTIAAEWEKEALEIMKNPVVFTKTFENDLCAASKLVDEVMNSYNFFIWYYQNQGNVAAASLYKNKKVAYLGHIILIMINTIYAPQLLVSGAFWNNDTKTIDKTWQDNVLNFMCYTLRYDFSSELVGKFETALMKIVTDKYNKEQADISSESFAQLKQHLHKSLKKCQEDIIKKREEINEPLKKAEDDFKEFMKVIYAAPPVEDPKLLAQLRQEHQKEALKLAQKWINLVPAEQLAEAAKIIKDEYKEAVERQVRFKGIMNIQKLFGYKEEDTTPLQQAFNQQLETIEREKMGSQPVVEEQSQQQQPEQLEEQKERQEEAEKELADYIATIKEAKNWDNQTVSDSWTNVLVSFYKRRPSLFNEETLKALLAESLKGLPADLSQKVDKGRVVNDIVEYVQQEMEKD